MRHGIYLLLLLTLFWSCDKKETTTEHDHGDGSHSHSHDSVTVKAPADTLEKRVVVATPVSPEYVQLATNVEVIPNINDAVKSVGVLTHEGIFGPLLFAEDIRSFFIELKPGMFLSEHPHPTESIVYTVKGKWVLCSEGKRQVMETGSVFHFGSNMPTGWEAPFADGALLFVVKSKEAGENYEPYMKGLKEMVQTLDQERANGNPFYFNELKADHPAILFARSVNPDFDEVLKNIPY
ncbi:MAG: cupin domain-containing protein [Flammeovirgaceae bacterium]|jgi:quercetin dioxygenase-like cupin family protein|nr:cupin domain-containing protein [Flammeovirgaceae bacterium]